MAQPESTVSPRVIQRMNSAGNIIRLLRLKQWTKNLLLFAGVLFSREITVPTQALRSFMAFFSFCFLSSALYVFNDLIDRENDRRHPRKRLRPLASGAVTPGAAYRLLALLGLAGLALAFPLGGGFLAATLVYIAFVTGYSLGLKRIAIIDLMILAFGFVIRAIAGAVAVGVLISPWLLTCTLSLSLLLATIKRRQEIICNSDQSREVLRAYPLVFLDQAITIVTAVTLMGYLLYTFSSGQSRYLMLTIPFVIYGILRYLLLMARQEGGEEPEEILLGDGPFLINILLWVLISFVVLYFG